MTGLHPDERPEKQRRRRAARRRNHYAKALSDPKFRQRTIAPKTIYKRKKDNIDADHTD